MVFGFDLLRVLKRKLRDLITDAINDDDKVKYTTRPQQVDNIKAIVNIRLRPRSGAPTGGSV